MGGKEVHSTYYVRMYICIIRAEYPSPYSSVKFTSYWEPLRYDLVQILR